MWKFYFNCSGDDLKHWVLMFICFPRVFPLWFCFSYHVVLVVVVVFYYSDLIQKHSPVLCAEAATGGVLQKKAVFKNFAIFTEKHQCWSLFLLKLRSLLSATLLKRDSNTEVVLLMLRNFIKTVIFKNIYERLLLSVERFFWKPLQNCLGNTFHRVLS